MNRPINILVECPALIPSVRVGVLETLNPLEQQGKCCIRFIETMNIKRTDLAWCDILICVRGFEYVSYKIVEAAKKAGRYIIYFLDDDLLNIPKGLSSTNYFSDEDQKYSLKRILKLSDILWCVNPKIGEKYSKYGNGNWILSSVPVNLPEVLNKIDETTINILYAGSSDHSELVQKYLSPVVRRISEEYGDNISFTFIGANPRLTDLKNITYYPFFYNYQEYKQVLKEKSYHIGLAPLHISEFYECKYYNKFIEYSTLGLMGVYSKCLPYTAIVEENVNGLLCDNTFDGWYNTINKAISDKELRQKCITEARNLIKHQFNPYKVAEKLVLDIPPLINFRAPNLNPMDISLGNIYLLFYLKRIQFLWEQYKLLAIPLIIYKAAKRVYKTLKK